MRNTFTNLLKIEPIVSHLRLRRGLRCKCIKIVLLASVAFCVPFPSQAQDAPGTHDYPLLSRFQGSTIRKMKVEDYGEFKVALGPGYQATGSTVALRKSSVLEGKHTMIQYQSPAGKSDLEIVRSYEAALTKLGFAKLFSCGTADCGVALTDQVYASPEAPNFMLASWNSTVHYTVWKGVKDGTEYTVAVGAVNTGSAPGSYQIDVVEHTPMAQGSVTVDAAQMSKSINADGHIALYGILFDTNSTAIKTESAATLIQIAALLKGSPSLKVAIVGHTDTQGVWAANMDLSRRRAEAVVHELTSKYDVSAARLLAAGVGAAAPISDNRTETGRAKNRRVELVELP